MIKNFILLCLGAFIVAFSYNYFDNIIVNIIISALGFLLMFHGYGNMLTNPLLKRINKLNLYHYIDKNFLQAIEEGFEDTSFVLNENEMNENKDYIDLYRRKHGSIVYKIEYELDEDDNYFYNCKFVKAYDMNEKEWIDEENKIIHLFRKRNILNYIRTAFFTKQEIPVEFNNKKYSCIVTSFSFEGEKDEYGNMMMEIDLLIIKEIDETLCKEFEFNNEKYINKIVEVSSKDGSYKHTYIEKNNG